MPGLGAVAIAFSSTERTQEKLDLLLATKIVVAHTHEDIGNSFLIYLQIVDPALLCQCFALEEPSGLIVGVLV